MTHEKALRLLATKNNRRFSDITINTWIKRSKIPLLFIPEVAHTIGCKPSDLSKFFARPLINLTNNLMGE